MARCLQLKSAASARGKILELTAAELSAMRIDFSEQDGIDVHGVMKEWTDRPPQKTVVDDAATQHRSNPLTTPAPPHFRFHGS